MNIRQMYKLHKWIAISVGVFFIVWTCSGIVMLLPEHLPAPRNASAPPPVDYRSISLSPAAAVAELEKAMGKPLEIDSVSLKQFRDTIAYEVDTENAGMFLVDARSGRKLELAPDLAEKIARDEFPSPGRTLQVALVDQHDSSYPWGPLPVYRIVFEDAWGTVSNVLMDGSIQRSDIWSRTQAIIAGLHTFEPIQAITGREKLTKGLLILTSAVGIAAVLTGYYLALPRRRVS